MNLSQYSHLNQDLAQSVDLFLMRKFESCFDLCKEIISVAKNEPEQERNEEVIEAATALGIQALAETDSWDQTFSFVNETYGAIDFCPPRIIQVCILLHVHMREFLLCHRLIQMWLQNPSNATHKMCSQVIRVYTQHVLCPTDSFDTLKQILESCKSMSKQTKSSVLEQVMTQIDSVKRNDAQIDQRIPQTESSFSYVEYQDQRLENRLVDCADSIEDDTANNDMDESNSFFPVQNAIISIFESACSFLKCRIKIFQNKHIQLMLMAVIAVLALIHSQTGDPVSSLGRLVIIWRVFLQRLGLLSNK